MAIRFLRTDGDEVLRKKSVTVKRFGETLGCLLDDMAESMYHYNGVGLAAPQIGISKRIVVVDDGVSGLIELVNPQIVHVEGSEVDVEGCLSVPGVYGDVSRAHTVRVSAQTRAGDSFELEAEGLMARVLQHEIDHLDGILFTDKAISILPPDEQIEEMDGK